jgi:hypothetical protein
MTAAEAVVKMSDDVLCRAEAKIDMHRQTKSTYKYNRVDGGVGDNVGGQTEAAGAAVRAATPRSVIWRLSNTAMVAFFLMATVVQINDPDPYIWIPIYLIPAFLSAAIVCKPEITVNTVWKTICVAHLCITIGGAIYLCVIVVQLMLDSMKNPLIYEEGREFAGLLIVACWLAVCRFTGSADAKQGAASVILVVSCVLGLAPLFFWALCFVGPLHSILTHCAEMQTAAAKATEI